MLWPAVHLDILRIDILGLSPWLSLGLPYMVLPPDVQIKLAT